VALPTVSAPLPSLLRTTFRRSLVLGRRYLVIGLAYSLVLTVALGTSAAKSSSGASSFAATVPILLPIFAVLGSMGGMVAFSNDRVKGVFEYLIAYGLSPRRLFTNSLMASLGVMAVQVGVSVALALGLSVALWHGIIVSLVELLFLYTVPMAVVSTALACIVGMYWTVVSSPREGMSSPIGLIPFVGIAPSALTLIVVEAAAARYGTEGAVVVLGVALATILVLDVVLLSLVGRLLRTDRLLSPM
jgi:hypothetical protein